MKWSFRGVPRGGVTGIFHWEEEEEEGNFEGRGRGNVLQQGRDKFSALLSLTHMREKKVSIVNL